MMNLNNDSSDRLVSKNQEFLFNYSTINSTHEVSEPKSCLSQLQDNCTEFFRELLLLPVMLLMFATAAERVTYKITVDRMLPFQFILIEIIFLLSWIVFSAMTMYKSRFTNEITEQMRQFPHSKIILMALIDTVQFILLTFSAAEVSPTMSVLLLHTSTMFVLIGSKFTFPNRKYSASHKVGVTLISLAIFICLSKIALNNILGESDFIRTICSLVYVSAAALQGLSMLYKEKVITDWSQPIDIYFLSSWLFWYQFLITVLLSLVYYICRGVLGFSLRADPFTNMFEGVQCFLGLHPDSSDPDTAANCSNSMWLICSYVLANFLVLVSTIKVLQLSDQILGRAMAAAIFVAFVVLWMYDIAINQQQRGGFVFSSNVGLCDIVAVIILLAGMEVHGRDPEPDEELITNFSPTSVATPAVSTPTTAGANTHSLQNVSVAERVSGFWASLVGGQQQTRKPVLINSKGVQMSTAAASSAGTNL